jgi:LETM1 and EF-hand domain-containing protein 1, mitochondrial
MLPRTVARRAFPVARGRLAAVSGQIPLRQLQRHQIPAIAILVPLCHGRSISTEPHRGGPPSGPPPGFNAEEAKKPLKAEPEKKPQDKEAAAAQEKQPIAESKEPPNVAVEGKPQTAAAETTKAAEDGASALTPESEKQVDEAKEKKLTLWQKIMREVHHYWDGTKLLAAEVKISTKLAMKMAAGYELTRRENRQLQRTVQDLGRLVPFSVFIIVPFAEALLPIALRLFPNMLPSTYEGQKSKDAKALVLRATRNEVSQFLRTTLKETGLPVTVATAQKEEFANFFRKVRSTGERPTAEDVIKVCKIFRDDLTLDNLSRPQLYSMCRYLNLSTFGTDTMMRYQIRHRMRQIKRDDRAISFEGVESLNVSELQAACAARGIRTHSVSPAQMRRDLQSWLDLRLKEGVPSTILVLSNAYMYSGDVDSQIDALTGVLSSIPEELFHEMELEVHNAEGAATNKQRLEVLKEQQDLIEEENEQIKESQDTGLATPRDVEDIDEKDERHIDAAGVDSEQAQEMIAAEAEAPTGAEVKAAVKADESTSFRPEEKKAPEETEKEKAGNGQASS